MTEVDIVVLPHNKYGLPKYGSPGAAGFDLQACIPEPITIKTGQIVKIPAGIAVAIPAGMEIQVRSRSGLALKGVVVANSPGTVDADYRGEICVILTMISFSTLTNPDGRSQSVIPHIFDIEPGMKIAQAVLCPVLKADFKTVSSIEDLGKTTRAAGGFGSTGL